MKKNITFLEARGGNDKGPDGYRKDTMPMVNVLKVRDWNAEVIFSTDDILCDENERNKIYEQIKNTADGYVSRVNPGNLKEEKLYFEMLRKFCSDEFMDMPHPDAMIGHEVENALTKLVDTLLVPDDTYVYHDIKIFRETFLKSLAKGERVLKQNRGSIGEGIWRARLEDGVVYNTCDSLPLDMTIICAEAKDNHSEARKLGEFMDLCEQYIIDDNDMLVDMTFLPHIKEGEIRILMPYETPAYVVCKKLAGGGDAFSATLFSGTRYCYDEPKDWKNLIDWFLGQLPFMKNKLGNYDLPLIWTADFVLDTDEKGGDRYILGEINCSRVGFASLAEFMEKIALMVGDNIVDITSEKKV